jgi:hypothetical protein
MTGEPIDMGEPEWEVPALQELCRAGFHGNSYHPLLTTLMIPLEWIEMWLPRMRNQCAGSMALEVAGLVWLYPRLSYLVDKQIQRW